MHMKLDASSPANSQQVELSSRARAWALLLLFLGSVLNVFDRQIINILAQDIKSELVISDAQLGLLTGTAFAIFYSFFGIPLGRLADRVDRVKLIAAALTTWSAFTIVCGTVGSFTQLFLARMGVGVGEAGSQPASTSLVSDFFSERSRVTAMSVLMLGGPIGAFLGLLIGGYVGSIWGWRAAFVVAGIPGIVLALVMLATLRDPRSFTPRAARPASASTGATLRALISHRPYIWLIASLTCSSFVVYTAGAWLPPFFIRTYGMSTSQAGGFAALAVGVGGALGTLGGGLFCDYLRRRVDGVEFKLILLSFGLCIPALFLTILSQDRSMALVGWFLFNMIAFAWQGPTMTMLQKAVGDENRAIGVAFASAFAIIFGLGCGLPLVGLVSDSLTAQMGPRGIGHALLAWISAVAAIGMFAQLRARIALRSQSL